MLWIVTSSLSLNAVRFGAHATVSLGRGLSAQHHRALLTMAVSDERAARAWLGNEDAVPAVQPPVAPMSVEEARAVATATAAARLASAAAAEDRGTLHSLSRLLSTRSLNWSSLISSRPTDRHVRVGSRCSDCIATAR